MPEILFKDSGFESCFMHVGSHIIFYYLWALFLNIFKSFFFPFFFFGMDIRISELIIHAKLSRYFFLVNIKS